MVLLEIEIELLMTDLKRGKSPLLLPHILDHLDLVLKGRHSILNFSFWASIGAPPFSPLSDKQSSFLCEPFPSKFVFQIAKTFKFINIPMTHILTFGLEDIHNNSLYSFLSIRNKDLKDVDRWFEVFDLSETLSKVSIEGVVNIELVYRGRLRYDWVSMGIAVSCHS